MHFGDAQHDRGTTPRLWGDLSRYRKNIPWKRYLYSYEIYSVAGCLRLKVIQGLAKLVPSPWTVLCLGGL
jgi:hypothetical protein